jgi:hypothetical protein
MRKLYPLLAILATPVVLILMSSSNGSPGGKSGSFGDGGATCTECHSGTASNVPNWITTDIPDEGYTPGEIYTITATGTHPGVVKFGFELTVENSFGAKVGTLQLTEPARTKFTNANKAVTHTAAGNVPSGNSNSWTMSWIAPENVLGDVWIYAAFNAANGNGNTSGDVVYKSSLFIAEVAPEPLLESILPDNAYQGQVVNTTIKGSNSQFGGSPDVFLSYSENGMEVINATTVVVVNAFVLQAEFDIPLSASAGLWDLHVDDLALDDSFTVNLVTAIAESNSKTIRVYPNPAYDHFFIENARGAEIMIFNTKGDLIEGIILTSDKQRFNISNLANGLYLVKITVDGVSRVEKLLVN